MIHFGKVESGAASGTRLDRSPRIIELAFDQIQIAGGIAKYPCATAPFTGMVGVIVF